MDTIAMVHWAQAIGPHTARLFEHILAGNPHPEMGYSFAWASFPPLISTHRLGWKAAAERALLTGACRYQSVKWILKSSLDVIPPSTPPSPSPPSLHDNICGAEYFE